MLQTHGPVLEMRRPGVLAPMGRNDLGLENPRIKKQPLRHGNADFSSFDQSQGQPASSSGDPRSRDIPNAGFPAYEHWLGMHRQNNLKYDI